MVFSNWKCQMLRLRSNKLMHMYKLGADQLYRKGSGKSWWTSWTWMSNVPSWQRIPVAPWAALGRALPAGQERWSFPPALAWDNWSAASSSGFSHKRRGWTYWSESNEGSQRWTRNWSIWHTRRGWEFGLFSLKKRRLKGITNVYQYLLCGVGSKEDRARFFSELSGERIRGNRHKFKYWKTLLNRSFFVVFVFVFPLLLIEQ